MPEMDRSYKSGIISPMHRSMAKTRSLPTITKKPAPARLSQPPPPESKLEDEHFSYFVPKAWNREGKEKLMSRSLSKLYKHPEKKVMLPFSGDGTGFRTQSSATEWWPAASRLHDEPTAYQEQSMKEFKDPTLMNNATYQADSLAKLKETRTYSSIKTFDLQTMRKMVERSDNTGGMSEEELTTQAEVLHQSFEDRFDVCTKGSKDR